MLKHILAAAVVLTLAASPAIASSCPKHMKAIDAALAKDPNPSKEKMADVKKLRSKGEAQHKAGDHTETMASLTERKSVVWGKSVYIRGEHGGSRKIKKKKKYR